jgi:hypothetical protein
VEKLGLVISKFITNNDEPGRRWISFVKGTKGKVTTHTDMITEAKKFLKDDNIEWDHTEYMKDEGGPGHPTKDRISRHMSDILSGELDVPVRQRL